GPTMQVKDPGSRVSEKFSRAHTGSRPEKKTFETSSATTAPVGAVEEDLRSRTMDHHRPLDIPGGQAHCVSRSFFQELVTCSLRRIRSRGSSTPWRTPPGAR